MNEPTCNKISVLLRRLVIMTVIAVIVLTVNPSSSYAGLIIRGGDCSAKALRQGAGAADNATYLSNLSVNYVAGEDDPNQFNAGNNLQGIDQYNSFCVGVLKQKTLKLKNLTLKPDRIQNGNQLHALLSGKLKNIQSVFTNFRRLN